eukprot:jgi/Tetstr1/437960/TSEL_026590.t1
MIDLGVQFGGLGIGDNAVIANAYHIGAAALVVGQAVTFLRAQHATMSDGGAFLSDPPGVSNPHSLYLVGASSIYQALVTPTLEPDAGANVSGPMRAVELRAAHTRVVNECGDAVLEDLAGPLASALKLLPSKRSHVARAGCSAARAEPAFAMRSAADLQAIPHYSDFPLHSMRKVQETPSHRIHTVDDLFQHAVPLGNTVPSDELKDLVPDAKLSLLAFNVVTGSYDPRSLKSTLLEFKTMRYGVKYTAVPRATAVDRFERSLLGDIQLGLAARDAAWHNTEPGQKGPLRDIMDMSEYTGMVFGTVGEVSKGCAA